MSEVRLPERLTLPHAAAALRSVEAALAAGGDLRLDGTAVVDLDTSAVALLLQAQRLARARGVGFALHAVPAKLQTLAQLYGVESLLGADASSAG